MRSYPSYATLEQFIRPICVLNDEIWYLQCLCSNELFNKGEFKCTCGIHVKHSVTKRINKCKREIYNKMNYVKHQLIWQTPYLWIVNLMKEVTMTSSGGRVKYQLFESVNCHMMELSSFILQKLAYWIPFGDTPSVLLRIFDITISILRGCAP